MLAVWSGSRLGERVWSNRMAWAATAAAIFDALENCVLLYEVIAFDSPTPYPQLALSFATAKFGLLAVVIAYVVIAVAASIRRR